VKGAADHSLPFSSKVNSLFTAIMQFAIM
jgi:hypothetical protein